jgi:phosphatidylglycerophosphatase GEP4
MVQWLNVPGLRIFSSVFFKQRHLARPDIFCKTISDIDWRLLKEQHGIRAIVLDKDNTLTAPYVDHIYPSLEQSVENLFAVFPKESVAILSNSAGTPDDLDNKQADNVLAQLGIPVIKHAEKKPEGFDEVLQHFDTVSDLQPREIAMIGDRILTDVVFGNLHGMLTIHVEPLTLVGDNMMAKIFRRFERLVFPFQERVSSNH